MCSERPALRNALFVLATVLVLLIPHTAAAQPEDRRLGVGILVGGFSGLSAKYYFGPSKGIRSTDLHLSIDIGSEFSAMGHLLLERALPGSPLVFVTGVGVLFEHTKDESRTGASGTVGILFVKHRFDVFMQVFPQVIFVPDIDTLLRWSVGIRYYL